MYAQQPHGANMHAANNVHTYRDFERDSDRDRDRDCDRDIYPDDDSDRDRDRSSASVSRVRWTVTMTAQLRSLEVAYSASVENRVLHAGFPCQCGRRKLSGREDCCRQRAPEYEK